MHRGRSTGAASPACLGCSRPFNKVRLRTHYMGLPDAPGRQAAAVEASGRLINACDLQPLPAQHRLATPGRDVGRPASTLSRARGADHPRPPPAHAASPATHQGHRAVRGAGQGSCTWRAVPNRTSASAGIHRKRAGRAPPKARQRMLCSTAPASRCSRSLRAFGARRWDSCPSQVDVTTYHSGAASPRAAGGKGAPAATPAAPPGWPGRP